MRSAGCFVLAAVASICLGAARPAGSADLILGEEPEVYSAVDKLHALGHVPGLLANTRPYAVQAVRSAVASSPRAGPSGTFAREIHRWLAGYVAPSQMGRVGAAASFSDARFTPANADGIPTPGGWSGRGSIAAREQTTPLASGQVRFVSFVGEGGDDGNRLLETSIVVGSSRFSVQAGKITTWYGPGRHGALIFTNNAGPYPGVRIRNPEPIRLPGRYAFLGGLQYDFFVARMESSRPIPRSFLSGARVAAKPSSLVEIGLSRAVHFGGEGKEGGLSGWWEAFEGSDENDPAGLGNGIGGFDVSVLLPFRLQPAQAYLEMAGEDQADGEVVSLPSKWAFLTGIFLPSIGANERWDLRVEFAANHHRGNGPAWYVHPPSGEGYAHRYRGDLLGHAMGTDARDLFVEGRYWLTPASYAGLSYERLSRYGADGERRSVASAGLTGWVTPSWRGEVHLSRESVSDGGSDFSAWVSLSWQTNQLVPVDVPVFPAGAYPDTTPR